MVNCTFAEKWQVASDKWKGNNDKWQVTSYKWEEFNQQVLRDQWHSKKLQLQVASEKP